MVINKIGQQHIDYGTNCQDYGIEFDGMKVVCDGCSEGKHSEVGAKAFCHLLKNDSRIIHECSVYTAAAAFGEMLGLFGQTSGSIRDFLCFTILMVTENETHFMVDYCGDGFIVKERLDGTIEFEELSDGEYPKYFAYNYVDKDMLKQYKDGAIFSTKAFPKDKYRNIGVASDGIRFAMKDEQFKKEFTEALQSGKEVRVKRFINKHQRVFQDDTTIVL